MQPINHKQGDAILDVVCQARVVNQAWEQYEAAKEAGEVKKMEETPYAKALARLSGLVCKTKELKVDESVIIGVLTRNLPNEVFSALMPKAAA